MAQKIVTVRNTAATDSAARASRLKRRIAAIVCEAHRSAFNETINIAAKDHPNGWAAYRWFDEAWRNVPTRKREVRHG